MIQVRRNVGIQHPAAAAQDELDEGVHHRSVRGPAADGPEIAEIAEMAKMAKMAKMAVCHHCKISAENMRN